MYYRFYYESSTHLYNHFMRTNMQNLILFSSVIACILQISQSVLPPYIHKLPLELTKNYVYKVSLYFGSQGQNISLLVDTGSKTLAVFCTECQNGCIINEQFNISQSQTFQQIDCSFISTLNLTSAALRSCSEFCSASKDPNAKCKGELAYGSSSISSQLDFYFIYDTIGTSRSGSSVFSSFGCIYKERHVGAIWGLSIDPDNELIEKICFNNLTLGYKAAKKMFSICTAGTSAIMIMCGIDDSIHIGPGYILRVNPDFDMWWAIRGSDIGQIKYGERVIRNKDTSFGRYGIIIDSGTDFIILPDSMVRLLQDISIELCFLTSKCTQKHNFEIFEYVFKLEDPNQFFSMSERVTFQIDGKVLQTPLSNYFWNIGSGLWALGVASRQKLNFPMSILGSTWMNNFDIVFDQEKATVTIYQINSCSSNTRLLQTDDQDNDLYHLPGERDNSINGIEALSRIRTKYQKSIQALRNN